MSYRWCPWFNTSTPCDVGNVLRVPSPTSDSPLQRATQARPTSLRVLAGAAVDYPSALQLAVQFFEAQRSGRVLHNASRVRWTHDSFLADGETVALDLSGGYADAGDYVKSTKTIGHSMSLLAWGLLEFKSGFGVGTHVEAVEALRWGVDYLLRCHPEPKTLIVQVGDFIVDHAVWGPPPRVRPPSGPRAVFNLTRGQPMTDVAAEVAAAFASASAVFHALGHESFSRHLLASAHGVLALANTSIGAANANNPAQRPDIYPQCSPEECFYWTFADGVDDKLAWALAWTSLAEQRINGNTSRTHRGLRAQLFALIDAHLNGMSREARSSQPFSWDSKWPAVYVLAPQLGHAAATAAADEHLTYWAPRAFNATGHQHQTPGGLVMYQPWGSLRYASHVAMLAVIHLARSGTESPAADSLWILARSQANYICGHNPLNRSFLTGFGPSPPLRVHHRWASGLAGDCARSRMREAANRHRLPGALVGGPYCGEPGREPWECDGYDDNREDAARNEVAIDFNAGLLPLLAGLATMPFAPPPAPPASSPSVPPWTVGVGCCTWPRPLASCEGCASFANASNWIAFSRDNCLSPSNAYAYTWCEPPSAPPSLLPALLDLNDSSASSLQTAATAQREPRMGVDYRSVLVFMLELVMAAASFIAAFASLEKMFVFYLWVYVRSHHRSNCPDHLYHLRSPFAHRAYCAVQMVPRQGIGGSVEVRHHRRPI